MSRTCIIHGGEIDESEAVELPGGWTCVKCYLWMETLVDEDDDDVEVQIVILRGDEWNDEVTE